MVYKVLLSMGKTRSPLKYFLIRLLIINTYEIPSLVWPFREHQHFVLT